MMIAYQNHIHDIYGIWLQPQVGLQVLQAHDQIRFLFVERSINLIVQYRGEGR